MNVGKGLINDGWFVRFVLFSRRGCRLIYPVLIAQVVPFVNAGRDRVYPACRPVPPVCIGLLFFATRCEVVKRQPWCKVGGGDGRGRIV